ncbi:helix-turn-helix domain-containing protein [Natronococcus occultus]|uniref:Putative DNA binding protein n=1 Tax=Natronococcus occultus SP4 TaxID=694430 RepID=L0K1U5_9EURY|nr:helix-turn-helix domain-containing protein [Natronococcus occultus]AGB38971.1 putative DNA binding protein [Natronococcus occultus SP4]
MYEATLAITDSSAYTEPTADTDCRIELWCNDHADLLSVRGSSIGSVLSRLEADVGIDDCVREDGEAVVITTSCLKRHETSSVDRYLEAHSCLLLPPLRYEDGRKRCRVLALRADHLADLYAALREDGFAVEVLSKREVDVPARSTPLLSAAELLPELTARQREVLSLAIGTGYYEIPRETTTAELADEIGIGRRAVDDHLRRAERKLVTTLSTHL